MPTDSKQPTFASAARKCGTSYFLWPRIWGPHGSPRESSMSWCEGASMNHWYPITSMWKYEVFRNFASHWCHVNSLKWVMVIRTIYTMEIDRRYKLSSVGGCFFWKYVCYPFISTWLVCCCVFFAASRTQESVPCWWALPQPPLMNAFINPWLSCQIPGALATSYHCAEQVKTKIQLMPFLDTSLKACVCLEEGTCFSVSLEGTHRVVGVRGWICSPVSVKRAIFSYFPRETCRPTVVLRMYWEHSSEHVRVVISQLTL